MDMALRTTTSVALALVGVACGGQVSAEATTAPEPESVLPDDAGSGVPSFGDSGPTMEVPVACVPCAADDACGGPQYACVASLGRPFCAAGCSKDGFCDPEQTCTWVVDPAGQRWRACLAKGNPCGDLEQGPEPRRPE
jgi:hypothetical protein